MAVFLNRPVQDLVVRGRAVLGMTQKQLADALGTSHRTVERWWEGRSKPKIAHVRALARLVYPRNRALALELAAAASETLLSLGLEAASAPVAPPGRSMLVEVVVGATAEALHTYPSAARAGLLAAFAKARAVGLTLDELAAELASASDERSSAPR